MIPRRQFSLALAAPLALGLGAAPSWAQQAFQAGKDFYTLDRSVPSDVGPGKVELIEPAPDDQARQRRRRNHHEAGVRDGAGRDDKRHAVHLVAEGVHDGASKHVADHAADGQRRHGQHRQLTEQDERDLGQIGRAHV